MLSRTSTINVIKLTFGGIGEFLVPPFMKAHHHLVQPLAKLPCRVLLELHPGVPELDIREETMRLQVPTYGGLEVGQLVRVGVEQALELVRPRLPLRPHRAGGEPDPLVVPALPERGDAEEVAPTPPERGDAEEVASTPPERVDAERLEVELR